MIVLVTELVGQVLFVWLRDLEKQAQSKAKAYEGLLSQLEHISRCYDIGYSQTVVSAQGGRPWLCSSDSY